MEADNLYAMDGCDLAGSFEKFLADNTKNSLRSEAM